MPRGPSSSGSRGRGHLIVQRRPVPGLKALSPSQVMLLPSMPITIKKEDSPTPLLDASLGHTPTPGETISLSVLSSPSLVKPQVKRRLELDPMVENEGFKTPKSKKRVRAQQTPPSVKSPLEKTRYDTSLGLLTKKFVGLLRSAPDGVLDLNKAAEYLDVQKRRIYDITNVLEGINLITKKSKNNIQWKGSGSGAQQAGLQSPHEQRLHSEIEQLTAKETQIDDLIRSCSLQLKMLTEDPVNSRSAYVTYQDIRKVQSFDEQTVIAIKAPPETRLEVPDPASSIQIWLKSTKGPIEVFLCPEEGSTAPGGSMEPGGSSAEGSTGLVSGVGGPERADPATSSCTAPGTREQDEETSSSPTTPEAEDTDTNDSFAGDPTLRNALLTEQNISPDSHDHLFLHTEDQNNDLLHFEQLEPPLSEEDYMFSLTQAEGISDLFDISDIDL